MFTVSNLARQADVTPGTVRHYVHVGLLASEKNPLNGYKIFDIDDIKKVRFVRQAKNLGFTLTEIGEIFDQSMKGDSPCPQVREIIRRRIVENHSKLKAMNALQKRMEDALKKWESMPDDFSDNGYVCHLIESFMPESANT